MAASRSGVFALRFDDSLKTVLAGDIVSGHGAQAAWRQLVDLMSRGRIPADEPAIVRLRMLRQAVPSNVRAASGRALAFAQPPAALVGLFAEDEIATAAPVLRTASLTSDEWIALLPRLGPTGRSILRHRRDLPETVDTALGAFGATDFVIASDASIAFDRPAPASLVAANDPAPKSGRPLAAPAVEVPPSRSAMTDALRQADDVAPAVRAAPNGFVISDLVARIDAFNRAREEPASAPAKRADGDAFRFETDASGVIRWVEGVARTAIVGVSLAYGAVQGVVRVDGVATGALRRRSRFSDARLEVGGTSDAAGSWRMSAVPVFDPASGRFTGLRGTARRPRADETTVPQPAAPSPAADALRQLVHELRTPTNAIAGFAELIETELLGAVPMPYRAQAGTIRAQASALIAAIDDLDIAARIEGKALELRPGAVAPGPLVARIVNELQPLASLRRASLSLDGFATRYIAGDDRAIERLVGRLLGALVSAAKADETIGVYLEDEAGGGVAIAVDRPYALDIAGGDSCLRLDSEDDDREGAPLLGTGFAVRLARNLAAEMGGALAIGARRLTLRLPASLDVTMEQAANP